MLQIGARPLRAMKVIFLVECYNGYDKVAKYICALHSILLLKLDEYGNNTAILKGIAVDLQTQILFPAIFAWGQYEDFKSQIKDKYQRIMVRLKHKHFTVNISLFAGFFLQKRNSKNSI